MTLFNDTDTRLKPDWPTVLSRTNLKTSNTNYLLRSPPHHLNIPSHHHGQTVDRSNSKETKRRDDSYSVDKLLVDTHNLLTAISYYQLLICMYGHWFTSPRWTCLGVFFFCCCYCCKTTKAASLPCHNHFFDVQTLFINKFTSWVITSPPAMELIN